MLYFYFSDIDAVLFGTASSPDQRKIFMVCGINTRIILLNGENSL